MDDARFWEVIDQIDREALEGGDEDGALEPLKTALAAMPEKQLEGFAETLARKLHALDGRRWADEAGESGGSDDAFLYARCFVVAQGQAVYERVLANPADMPKSLDERCESLLYLAQEAFEQGGGEWTFQSNVSYETGSNRAQWPDD